MTADQYRAILATLGLSQQGAARLLGVNGRTSRRWIAGTVPVPQAVAMLLRLMVTAGLTPDHVAQFVDRT